VRWFWVGTGLLASSAIAPGASEVEVWSEFHHHLIATERQNILRPGWFQSGPRTFSVFSGGGTRPECGGRFLVCFGHRRAGYMHYAVDFSRTFSVRRGVPATPAQMALYPACPMNQLHHNAALAGTLGRVVLKDFARAAWSDPPSNRGPGITAWATWLGLWRRVFPISPCFRTGWITAFDGGSSRANGESVIESYSGQSRTPPGSSWKTSS